MSEYFPELRSSRERVKVELDLSNFATTGDLTGGDTSNLPKRLI